MSAPDVIVVGGGLVGAAIAYGLQNNGTQTLMLDEGDVAFRAARGNFGLVWTQSKGIDNPAYANWTWESAERWAGFADELAQATGAKLDYRRPGGVQICLSDAEMDAKQQKMEQLQSHAPHIEYRMLERKALGNLLPGLGPDVVGGCLSPGDGDVNPLALLRALHTAFQAAGGQVISGTPVQRIDQTPHGFKVETSEAQHDSGKVVIAAGLGTPKLAAMVGLDVKVRPQRGQNLITERMKPFLNMPLSGMRQTGEGGVQIGETQEEVGFNDAVTSSALGRLSARAVRIFPHLRRARIVRAWGALRIMSPDGAPIYAESTSCPGAYAAVCHSGVTLAAAHAGVLAPAIAQGTWPDGVAELNAERFVNAPN